MLLTISVTLKAQDSIVAKPLELGLPEGKQPREFTLEEKYGKDTSDWPIWTKRHYRPGKGMALNEIEFSDLFIDGTRRLNSFDSTKAHTVKTSEFHDEIHIFQGRYIYLVADTGVIFSAFKEPITDGSLKLTLSSQDSIRDLSTLKNLSKALPLSYEWRDSTPNWVDSFFDPDDRIYLNIVPVGLLESRARLDLHYYKGTLMFIDYSPAPNN